MQTFPDTGRPRGIAYIDFATEEAAALAVAKDGKSPTAVPRHNQHPLPPVWHSLHGCCR